MKVTKASTADRYKINQVLSFTVFPWAYGLDLSKVKPIGSAIIKAESHGAAITGISLCSPSDEYNEEVGYRICRERILALAKKNILDPRFNPAIKSKKHGKDDFRYRAHWKEIEEQAAKKVITLDLGMTQETKDGIIESYKLAAAKHHEK